MTTAVSPRNLHPPRMPDEETDTERIYRGVAFASSDYVPWIVGKLRLGRADLGRMRTAGVPVLRSHMADALVGQVQRVEKADGVWRSDWRLPRIPSNADTFDQMDTGILRGVSVGGSLNWATLKIDNEDEADWSDPDSIMFSCDWMLVEESLTAIPADTRAGVDRSLAAVLQRDGAIIDTIIGPSGIITMETPDVLQRIQTLVRNHNNAVVARKMEETMTTQAVHQDDIARAVAEHLDKSDVLRRLAEVPDKLDTLAASHEAEVKANMEYRSKLDRLQFQPNGQVLQMENWRPGQDDVLSVGKLLRLTAVSDAGFPALDRQTTSLEESFLERQELALPGRNVIARIPWAALEERERQLQLQRATMANAAGARPLDITVLGNAGLVLSAWAPVLARMDVHMGVTGGQKLPWATTQPTAAADAEGAAITVSNLVFDNTEILPVSIASAYRLTSALRAVDDGLFERVARFAISDVLQDQVTGQVLVGGGTNEIAGLWGTTGVQNLNYGAAQTNFDRTDAVDLLDNVRLSKTDGMVYAGVLSSTLWKLCERTLRGGTASDMYLLEMDGPHMGMMEGERMYHYADLAPSGITDPGLFFKADRVVVWFWGDSLTLEIVPELSRQDAYKMCAETNMRVQQPTQNVSRIKQD